MALHEIELQQAKAIIRQTGGNEGDYSFTVSFLPPGPDGAGMFTVRYEVNIENKITSKSMATVGGIGLRWVDDFEGALRDGYFN